MKRTQVLLIIAVITLIAVVGVYYTQVHIPAQEQANLIGTLTD